MLVSIPCCCQPSTALVTLDKSPLPTPQMMGLHPTSVTDNFQTELDIVHQKLFEIENGKLKSENCPSAASNSQFSILNSQFHKYVAVGEIGLDLYWDKTYLDQQLQALRLQIAWAQELQLPICLHIRKAHNELFSLLRDINSPHYSGVMHCFGGSVQEAQRAIEMGFHIGIGGVVTFKNATLADVAWRPTHPTYPLSRTVANATRVHTFPS